MENQSPHSVLSSCSHRSVVFRTSPPPLSHPATLPFPPLFNNNSLILPLVQSPLFLIKWKVENLWPFSQFIATPKDDRTRSVAWHKTTSTRNSRARHDSSGRSYTTTSFFRLLRVYESYDRRPVVCPFPQVHNCPIESPSFITFCNICVHKLLCIFLSNKNILETDIVYLCHKPVAKMIASAIKNNCLTIAVKTLEILYPSN